MYKFSMQINNTNSKLYINKFAYKSSLSSNNNNNNNKSSMKKKITFCSNKRSVHDFDKIKG